MIAPVERAMAVEVDQRVRIAAPPERVWRALTDVADLRRWLFESADADVRDGGSWRFTFPHWPSARGLNHPALNFGGPIVELVPGRVLAVQFEPPYWGVLRFEVSPAGDGTDLRVTQRGFEGNEEWLADFRGGWGSFSDRLALLCEVGEVATARRLEGGVARALEPAELAGALAAAGRRSPRPLLVRRRPAGSRSCSRASSRPPATNACAEPCDALCLSLPPGADIEDARASLERSLPRRGWTAAGALRVAVDPASSRLRARASPTARLWIWAIPSRSCVPSSAPSARPAAPRQPPTSPRAVRSRWPAAHILVRSTRRSRASRSRPSRASGACDSTLTACSPPTGKAPAGLPAATAARARGRSPATVASSGSILRFDPAVPRMVAA